MADDPVANVRALRAVEPAAPEPSAPTVELLEKLLADAKAGKIIAILCACETPTSFVFSHSWGDSPSLFGMYWAADQMKVLVQKKLDE